MVTVTAAPGDTDSEERGTGWRESANNRRPSLLPLRHKERAAKTPCSWPEEATATAAGTLRRGGPQPWVPLPDEPGALILSYKLVSWHRMWTQQVPV